MHQLTPEVHLALHHAEVSHHLAVAHHHATLPRRPSLRQRLSARLRRRSHRTRPEVASVGGACRPARPARLSG